MFHCYTIWWIIFNLTSEFICGYESATSQKQSTKLPPCKACKTFVESFKKGFEQTSKITEEQNSASYDEKFAYSSSDVRFDQIKEKLCSDVVEGKEQCYNLLKLYEKALERWWLKNHAENLDLYKYLCIDIAEVCCPDMHFGKNCTPCPIYPNVCHNNGRCKGSGTRKGDGKCVCYQGYSGEYCDKCANSYYVSYKDGKKFLCSECHQSCKGTCEKAGPIGCRQCKEGWLMSQDKGCVDINECAFSKSPCSPLQFCVNNEGGYRCLDCDRACAGCTGDGPDMCINCASGYYKQDNMCIDGSQESRKNFISISRYLTYIGLCIATCIILSNNIYIAAIIGSCVAVYISVSEYMLNYVPAPMKSDVESQLADQVLKAFN